MMNRVSLRALATPMFSTWLIALAPKIRTGVSKRMIQNSLLKLMYRTCKIRWPIWKPWVDKKSLSLLLTTCRRMMTNIKLLLKRSQRSFPWLKRQWNIKKGTVDRTPIISPIHRSLWGTRTKTRKDSTFTWILRTAKDRKWNPQLSKATEKTRKWPVVSSTFFVTKMCF